MNKKLFVTLIATFAISSSVFAIDTATGSSQAGETTVSNVYSGSFKQKRKLLKDKIKQLRWKTIGQIKGYRTEVAWLRGKFRNWIKQTRNQFRAILMEEYKQLSTGEKLKLREIRKHYVPQIKELWKQFRTAKRDERESIIEKIKELRDTLHNEILKIVWWTSYWEKLKEKWEKIFKMNQEKRQNIQAIKEKIKQAREQFKWARDEMIVTFKTLIYQRFKSKINNMSLERLEKVQKRIEQARERFNKMHLSEATRTKIMSILAALNEIITKRINELSSEKQALDTDTTGLLNWLLWE